MIVCGFLTFVLATLLALGLNGFSKLNRQYANPVADVQVAGTAQQIARGQRR
jgi:hypothetical protein